MLVDERGWTEMAWHLYQWGDTVEVVAPEELRAMVEGYRRDDTLRYSFPADRYKCSDSAPIVCRFSRLFWTEANRTHSAAS